MATASEILRKEFKKNDDIRDAGLTTPDDIVRYDDIVYGDDPKWQSLDVYRPKNEEGRKLPVIVSIHGGGWVYGDKERYQYYCMNLAQRGFAVVNYSYRLAPEVKFPASLEDTNSVFHWIMDNAEKYGLDTDHVFGVGDSAGAHILGLYSGICTNADYAAEFGFKAPKGFAPTAVAFNCGAYHVEMTPGDAVAEQLAESLPEGGSEEEQFLVNVLEHITPDYPPVFFMTANDDFLKEQAPPLAAKLAEESVPFVYRFYGDANTRLAHIFHCDMRSESARFCNDEECDYFKRYL